MITRILLTSIFIANFANAGRHFSQIDHMEYYRNKTRPSKAFSFSTNYFNQNVVSDSGKGGGKERVQCGTRTVDFNPRRSGKVVGGAEPPYGAFPWQVRYKYYTLNSISSLFRKTSYYILHCLHEFFISN